MELSVPAGNRLNGNCGVTAVAAVAGVHFDEAFELIRKSRGAGDRWKGSSNNFDRKKALDALGVKYTQQPRTRGPKQTLRKWIEWNAKPDATYIVTTTGHVQVVKGSTVLDQQGPSDISEYWGKSKWVKSVLLIDDVPATVEPAATERETMTPDKAYIVARLSEIGKTQMALGEALKIDRAQVTRLLQGKRKVQLDEVPIMARFLDISNIEMLRRLGLDV